MVKNILGGWAFLIGVVLAFVSGILTAMDKIDITGTYIASVLVVLGLLIGLLNITGREVTPFLFSGLVLILTAGLGVSFLSSVPSAGEILFALMLVFVPATIVVAVKNVFSMAKK